MSKNKMDSDRIKESDSFAATDATEHLRGIEDRLATAWVEGDRSFIEQILADDWTVIDLAGRILNKAEVLEEAFDSKDRKIVSMHIDELTVRLFEGWAKLLAEDSSDWRVSRRNCRG